MKDPNYRESQKANLFKTLIEITIALDIYWSYGTKTKHTISNSKPSKGKVLAKLKEKIIEFNKK